MMHNMNTSTAPVIRSEELFSVEKWRERFLRTIQIGAAIFGLIALVPNVLTAPNSIFIAIYISAYMTLLVTVFAPLQYNIRAGAILFLLYALGLSGIFEDGLWGDARLFFLAFVCLSLLLFTYRLSIFAMALSIITLAVGGWMLHTGQFQISNTEVPIIGSPATWLEMGVIFILLSAVLINGLRLLKQEFSMAQDHAHQTLQDLREERANLEERVRERTANLARKTDQLRTASYIARQTAELQDLATLLDNVVKLITDQFGYYHAGIFLLNEQGNQAILQAASSEGGKRMIEKGHWLAVGTHGIVGYAAAEKKPRIASDVGGDAIYFNNPDLPMTRSEVALPLLIRNKTIGVLDIQSTAPQAFSREDIEVLQTLADQITVAIENARLLSESQAAVLQLESLTAVRTREAWQEMFRETPKVFTYSPLGLKAEKVSMDDPNSVKIPITLRGQRIGTVTLTRKSNNLWNKLDEELVSEVAGQVGLAVDNLRLLEEAQKSAKRDQILATVSARIRETLDMQTILQSAAREFQRALDLKETEVRLGLPTTDEAKGNNKRSQQLVPGDKSEL